MAGEILLLSIFAQWFVQSIAIEVPNPDRTTHHDRSICKVND